MAGLIKNLLDNLSGQKLKMSRPSALPLVKRAPQPVNAEFVDDMIPATPVPMTRRARISGIGEPPNLSTTLDVEQIQAALRAAERGDTWRLFTIYRDMVIGCSHLQAEWGKRKNVVVGQAHSLVAHRKGNADDDLAVQAIKQMIDHCENWMDGLMHLLDATLYPVSVAEKIYMPVGQFDEPLDIPVRYLLKRIDPINYSLFCFKVPYMPASSMAMASPIIRTDSGYFQNSGVNPALEYDPDEWESDLRFYDTIPVNGMINFSVSSIYEPEPSRHIVHRGNMLSRSIRDNFGGQMRAILFWWLLSTKDRDWFALYMEKYGSPFILGKADAAQKDTVEFLRQAFATATKIGGLVIDKRSEAELIQASSQDGANAHKTLIEVCNSEISKIVLGQILSSTPKNTGLGSGVADLHGQVREDIRQYDTMKLDDTLRRQVFQPYLKINGFKGQAPHMIWGGIREGAARESSETLKNFRVAGLTPDDEALGTLSQRFGYGVRRMTKEELAAASPAPNQTH